MAEIETINETASMQARARQWLREGKSIGFVPTMGALHAGHRALIARARKENDIVVVSIYVNPTQFGMGEDFEKYPRMPEADTRLSAEAGADCIFAPETLYSGDARSANLKTRSADFRAPVIFVALPRSSPSC